MILKQESKRKFFINKKQLNDNIKKEYDPSPAINVKDGNE